MSFQSRCFLPSILVRGAFFAALFPSWPLSHSSQDPRLMPLTNCVLTWLSRAPAARERARTELLSLSHLFSRTETYTPRHKSRGNIKFLANSGYSRKLPETPGNFRGPYPAILPLIAVPLIAVHGRFFIWLDLRRQLNRNRPRWGFKLYQGFRIFDPRFCDAFGSQISQFNRYIKL